MSNEVQQTGIIYPNPYTDYLEGYRDYGEADEADLAELFPVPDAALTVEERRTKMRERFERFLPPFVSRTGDLYTRIASSFASALSTFAGDRLLRLRRVFAGGTSTQPATPEGQVTYDDRRAMQQLADEYRVIRSRAETVPQLYSLIRNWRAIHLLRGTLNGPTQETVEGVASGFGLKYDLERITRAPVSFKTLDNSFAAYGAQAEWLLDHTYPDYDEYNAYSPEQPVRFLDIPRILLIYAVNNNAMYYVHETIVDRNWYLDETFIEGRVEGDTFVHAPDTSNVFLDVAGTLVKVMRNVDGYYTNREIAEVTRRDLTPAWVHFQFVLEVAGKVSAVVSMSDPVVAPQ